MSNEKIVYEISDTKHWKLLFEKKNMLLGSHNLRKGEELVCRIKRASVSEIKDINGNKKNVPVLEFHNCNLPLVMNVGTARTVSALYGPLYTDWEGKDIQLYSARVKVKGEMVDALRVRPFIPAAPDELSAFEKRLRECKTMAELQDFYMSLPKNLKRDLCPVKDEVKGQLS